MTTGVTVGVATVVHPLSFPTGPGVLTTGVGVGVGVATTGAGVEAHELFYTVELSSVTAPVIPINCPFTVVEELAVIEACAIT